ncbi:MAG TPA: aminoglycoside phosphotransferase family protein [Candidatus Saccharimonadales bacterium]|nr:aminoglycoside phosphotransferase family protein [Candidatus Saccharimonadales bacterium]
MKQPDLERINAKIADRSRVFYWQTDRAVEPEEAGHIWADRHRYFDDKELLERVNQELLHNKIIEIVPLDPKAQTNLGNVNSVRVGRLASGEEIIIRCHPKGIINGYFHAEAAAARRAKQSGLPSYSTLAIHDYQGEGDFAFHVMEKLPGKAVQRWLDDHPETENDLLPKIGSMMARLHEVKAEGFGPFNNRLAKTGKLKGIHSGFGHAVDAALSFNLGVLVKQSILTSEQSKKVDQLFANNPLLDIKQAVLVHNDFADWNLLTDGQEITGILDWDECVAGDPVADIACWSTFFDPKRQEKFLDGYWQVAEKPADFEDKFELLRLRYVISKMTLRTRRYAWEPSDFMKQKIEDGKKHLAESITYFGIEG